MIKSFKESETEKIYHLQRSRRLPPDIQQIALRKLRMLNNAISLQDLRSPPGNRLERLSGDRVGQYSIRINDQWRICFEWRERDAFNVEITDYHWEIRGMAEDKLNPIHPGEVLLEEFLKPIRLSQNRLALDIGVHPRRINEIVLGKRGITADTALRLARFFGTSPQFWLGLQNDYDLDIAAEALHGRLEREVKVYSSPTQPNPPA